MTKRLIIGGAAAVCAFMFGAGAASAATPAVQGCVGASVSANAQLLQPYGANFISVVTPRNDFGSLGDAAQVLQAGGISDDVYANTCNDG